MKNLEYYEDALKHLSYNPDTGDFTWLESRGKAKAGDLAGTINSEGYRIIGFQGKSIPAHRLAFLKVFGYLPSCIDHINREESDNRICNLRGCTQAQNSYNRVRRKQNTSGHHGVNWDKGRGMWRAQICLQGRKRNLGRFNNLEDAIEARRQGEKKYFGDFAPNNP